MMKFKNALLVFTLLFSLVSCGENIISDTSETYETKDLYFDYVYHMHENEVRYFKLQVINDASLFDFDSSVLSDIVNTPESLTYNGAVGENTENVVIEPDLLTGFSTIRLLNDIDYPVKISSLLFKIGNSNDYLKIKGNITILKDDNYKGSTLQFPSSIEQKSTHISSKNVLKHYFDNDTHKVYLFVIESSDIGMSDRYKNVSIMINNIVVAENPYFYIDYIRFGLLVKEPYDHLDYIADEFIDFPLDGLTMDYESARYGIQLVFYIKSYNDNRCLFFGRDLEFRIVSNGYDYLLYREFFF